MAAKIEADRLARIAAAVYLLEQTLAKEGAALVGVIVAPFPTGDDRWQREEYWNETLTRRDIEWELVSTLRSMMARQPDYDNDLQEAVRSLAKAPSKDKEVKTEISKEEALGLMEVISRAASDGICDPDAIQVAIRICVLYPELQEEYDWMFWGPEKDSLPWKQGKKEE